jgi:hypothetical protein
MGPLQCRAGIFLDAATERNLNESMKSILAGSRSGMNKNLFVMDKRRDSDSFPTSTTFRHLAINLSKHA